MSISTQISGVTRPIRVSDIKVRPAHRKPSARTVSEIAESIQGIGLLHAIGVAPLPDGKYSLLFGGNRLAAHKELGIDVISASVIDIDAADMDAVMHAENLFRVPLSTKDRLKAAADWAKWYKEKHPESFGTAARSAAAKESKAPAEDPIEACEGVGGALATVADARAVRAAVPATALAKVTGQSRRSASRDIRIAEALSEEQRAALTDRGVTINSMEKVAGIADLEKRNKAVTLIASGMDHDTAIVLAQAPPNATLEIVNNPNTDGFKPEAEMSDEEWFNTYCGETAARLKFVAIYKIDALFWRHTQGYRHEFKNKTKRLLAQSKVGLKGPFMYLAARLVNITHPMDWMPCGPCGGTGQCGSTSKCTTCRGNAFAITTG